MRLAKWLCVKKISMRSGEAEVVHWTGLKLGELEIGEAIGDGAFSRIYRAVAGDGTKYAIKVAGTGFGDGSGATGFFQSRALEQITSGFAEFAPEPVELLQAQYEYLMKLQEHPEFVRVYEMRNEPSFSYMRMEYLDGKSLREHMLDGSADIRLMLPLLAALDRLDLSASFRHHGDLKPENLVLVGSELRFVDPGYYGIIHDKGGKETHAAITTPAYYPGLNGDDLYAAGLIFWELACGEQLLKSERPATIVGPQLEQKITGYERTGNHFYSSLRSALAPHKIKEMPKPLSAVLQKSVRLNFDTGIAEFDPGYKSFAEFLSAVRSVL